MASFFEMDVFFAVVFCLLFVITLAALGYAVTYGKGLSVIKIFIFSLVFACLMRAAAFIFSASTLAKAHPPPRLALPTTPLVVISTLATAVFYVAYSILLFSWVYLFNNAAGGSFPSFCGVSHKWALGIVNIIYGILECVKYIVVFTKDTDAETQDAIATFEVVQGVYVAMTAVGFLGLAVYLFRRVGDRIQSGTEEGATVTQISVFALVVTLCMLVRCVFAFVPRSKWVSDLTYNTLLYTFGELVPTILMVVCIRVIPSQSSSSYSYGLGDDGGLSL